MVPADEHTEYYTRYGITPQALDSGVTWFGWRVPSLVEVGIVLALGLAMMAVAILQFSRTE